MKKNKGFTLIELMIVIAIIAIIAAIAIPNLMQSRIRANEATAVTVIKSYATAQVTYQVGRQGRVGANSNTGDAGFADNFRNLHYGTPVGASSGFLELISQTHADAATNINDNGTATVGAAALAGPYQGYHFQSPTGVTASTAADVNAGWFATQFGQLAVPANSTTTGTNAYYVGVQGTVWMYGLPEGQALNDSIGSVGAVGANPASATIGGETPEGWSTL